MEIRKLLLNQKFWFTTATITAAAAAASEKAETCMDGTGWGTVAASQLVAQLLVQKEIYWAVWDFNGIYQSSY